MKSLLELLEVDVDSQVLVFSKTSLQASKISPKSPRAIYFRDDVYVGWVPEGELIEVTAVDNKLGAVFYSLKQTKQSLDLNREISRCVTCHASTHTRRVPGHIVRSVHCDHDGQPLLNLGSFITTDRSPFDERWGGWYVTGHHGRQKHMGNLTLRDQTPSDQALVAANRTDDIDAANSALGFNWSSLKDRFDTTRYLSPHSDLVSLMILEHQTSVQNTLTSACHAGRIAEAEMLESNALFERPTDFVSDSFNHRFESAAKMVVQALLMKEAIEFSDEIVGTSNFANRFQSLGSNDSYTRSLRQLDLSRRLFRYSCSYLIYSGAFRSLPIPVLQRVYRRLNEVLSAKTTDDEFHHISLEERRDILDILKATGLDIATLSTQSHVAD
ncbi:MAG: hypothetical protein U0930_17210 [Pirellulales bacterium]